MNRKTIARTVALETALVLTVAGLIAGGAAGLGIGALGRERVAPPPPSAEPAAAASGSIPEPPARAERRGPSLETSRPHVAGAPARPRPAPPAEPAPSPGRPDEVPEAQAAPAPIAPGEARVLALELQAEALSALETGDGARALAILKRLGTLGEEADAVAIDLALRLRRELASGRKVGITTYDLQKALRSQELVPLLERSLLDPTVDARFRARAVENLAFSPKDDTLPFVLSLVDAETDPRVRAAMVEYLSEQSDPAVGAAFARTFARLEDPRERLMLIEALGQAGDAEAVGALERAAAEDADPRVRTAAHVELVARRPPAPGYLLTDIGDNTPAGTAGLRPGDIILAYNGVPLGPGTDLGAERDRAAAAGQGAVPVTVWRAGRTFEVTLRAGRLGVDGRTVAPTAR